MLALSEVRFIKEKVYGSMCSTAQEEAHTSRECLSKRVEGDTGIRAHGNQRQILTIFILAFSSVLQTLKFRSKIRSNPIKHSWSHSVNLLKNIFVRFCNRVVFINLVFEVISIFLENIRRSL